MYNKYSLKEYNATMTLRKKYGYGIKKINYFLEECYGIKVGKSAIARWIYRSGRPFNEVLIKKIPKSSKKLSIEKAYILGVLCGDGYISTGYRIGLNVCDKEFADHFQYCMEKAYGLRCSRSERVKIQKQYEVMLCSKRVIEDLLKYHKSFKTKEWTIPRQILNADNELKAAFLRGFADSEAGVRFRRNGFGVISLTSGNRNSLIQLQEMLLNDFGIKSKFKVRKIGTVFVLYVSDYNSLVLFYTKIGFIIKRKWYVLESVLKSYKRYGLKIHPFELKRKALILLEKYKDYEFVGQLIGVHRASIYDWENANLTAPARNRT